MRVFVVIILLSLSIFVEAFLFQFILFLCAIILYCYKDIILLIYSKN